MKARSTAVTGWAMTRSGISQTISLGCDSRKFSLER